MIGSRDRYGAGNTALKAPGAVYSYSYYLLDGEHARHQGLQIDVPTFWQMSDGVNGVGFGNLKDSLPWAGSDITLAKSLETLLGNGPFGNIDQNSIESLITGERPNLVANDSVEIVSQLLKYLSAVIGIHSDYLDQGGIKGRGMVEQLSVSPLPGVRYTPAQRAKLDGMVFSSLSPGSPGLAVWHLGKSIRLNGVPVKRDDVHYLLCDYVPGSQVELRLTNLSRGGDRNYLWLFKRTLERFVFDVAGETDSNGNVLALDKVQLVKSRARITESAVVDDLLELLPEEQEPSVEAILEAVRPRGWDGREVESKKKEQSTKKRLALTPPGFNKPVYFSWNTLERKLRKGRERRKRSKVDEIQIAPQGWKDGGGISGPFGR